MSKSIEQVLIETEHTRLIRQPDKYLRVEMKCEGGEIPEHLKKHVKSSGVEKDKFRWKVKGWYGNYIQSVENMLSLEAELCQDKNFVGKITEIGDFLKKLVDQAQENITKGICNE